MNEKIIGRIFIAVSLICAYLTQAPFTPAIIITISMFFVALAYLVKKSFKIAGTLFAINSIAVYGIMEIFQVSY